MRATLLCLEIVLASCGDWNFHRTGTAEEKALLAVSKLLTAESEYHVRFGRYGSTQDLSDRDNRQLDSVLESARQAGYRINVTPTKDGFVLRGKPMQSPGGEMPGRRAFYADQTGIVRYSWLPREADGSSEPLR